MSHLCALLLEIGAWLEVNGEAIYDTTPWIFAAEGPTHLDEDGMFNEADLGYTGEDVRFTVKEGVIYATVLAWPGEEARIVSLGKGRERFPGLYESEIDSITMLGSDGELDWTLSEEALVIRTPPEKPGRHAFVFKITRKAPLP